VNLNVLEDRVIAEQAILFPTLAVIPVHLPLIPLYPLLHSCVLKGLEPDGPQERPPGTGSATKTIPQPKKTGRPGLLTKSQSHCKLYVVSRW